MHMLATKQINIDMVLGAIHAPCALHPGPPHLHPMHYSKKPYYDTNIDNRPPMTRTVRAVMVSILRFCSQLTDRSVCVTTEHKLRMTDSVGAPRHAGQSGAAAPARSTTTEYHTTHAHIIDKVVGRSVDARLSRWRTPPFRHRPHACSPAFVGRTRTQTAPSR